MSFRGVCRCVLMLPALKRLCTLPTHSRQPKLSASYRTWWSIYPGGGGDQKQGKKESKYWSYIRQVAQNKTQTKECLHWTKLTNCEINWVHKTVFGAKTVEKEKMVEREIMSLFIYTLRKRSDCGSSKLLANMTVTGVVNIFMVTAISTNQRCRCYSLGFGVM